MITLLSLAMLALSLAHGVHGQAGSAGSAVYTTDTVPELTVITEPPSIVATRGGNLTLPCRLHRTSTFHFGTSGMRVKWTKYSPDLAQENDVFVSMGFHKKAYGGFQDRAFLREADDSDATLIITDVGLDDYGKYKCEVIDGMDDNIVEVTVEFQDKAGIVFPYSPRLGRYNLNFHDGEKACMDQDAVVASFEQLYDAWQAGLDWCNAGWLNDGSVQYPINKPRGPCGGTNSNAGLRNYGRRDKFSSRFDVFCFTGAIRGRFYWLVQPNLLTYTEAVQACQEDEAEIAKVGHMYSAWKLQGYDRCDAGWLADGSVRYPISNPRKNCSPDEAAVRMVGFPDKKQKLYGVYCYKAQ
ncbi:hyaluronan and proteoglycan link protein 1a isoform X1 [Clupea harengus]|uniref:Hyaluronan and proteoglycan link protein 1a isoform X1 n=1 Tax=Clupea harengus TaxID=7950 RepID=A0A6P8FDF5_CLUHA|nr:hyaluronan and proteoglycan link protein 1a isoform X1 [Clupea harengus]XP_042564202.1 hyaluronan and proteoglycan link protein 1a isoform X1 [Clupea harengus]XP_042564203.1 hyaluronan and proteoglycan link protein 1a isoform X1 [Clupea harengus]